MQPSMWLQQNIEYNLMDHPVLAVALAPKWPQSLLHSIDLGPSVGEGSVPRWEQQKSGTNETQSRRKHLGGVVPIRRARCVIRGCTEVWMVGCNLEYAYSLPAKLMVWWGSSNMFGDKDLPPYDNRHMALKRASSLSQSKELSVISTLWLKQRATSPLQALSRCRNSLCPSP